ncbi:MAG: DUF3800 domain-containing protein [Candidatus Omnitrophota bacterium]
MFVDETGDHNLIKIDEQYPIFSLSGVIFERNYYYKEVTSLLHAFKLKYFNSIDIILHQYDIRKRNAPFNILLNESKREDFFKDLNELISSLKFTIISITIDKKKFVEHQDKFVTIDKNNPYVVSINFLIERYVRFLEINKAQGFINIESRGPENDKNIYRSYMDYYYNGTSVVSSRQIKNKIVNFAFYNKQINVNGLQIADLIIPTLAKKALGEENRIYPLIKDKIFASKTGRVFGIGLKRFP